MLFYILTILIAVVIIIAINILIFGFSVPMLLWITVNTVVAVVAIVAFDGIGAFIVRRLLPAKWFLPEKNIFAVSKREHDFYKKIKIKSWKDKVPELGGFTGFSKSELKSTNDTNYLSRFILEANYGVVCHLQNAIFGFLILFIPFFDGAGIIFPMPHTVWLPIFIVNFVLSILPVFILRYTTYTLARLYAKQKRREKKKNTVEI